MTLDDMLAQLTPEGVDSLRTAVEIGKWADGSVLNTEQRQLCLQALIAWEQQNLPAEDRSGFMPASACSSDTDDIQIIKGPEA